MGLLDLTVTGNMAILEGLVGLEAKIKLEVQAKLEEAGDYALEVANELVPVDTGYLKSTLYKETENGVVKVGADASYAVFQELGFHHYGSGTWVPPQPYLVPAMIAAGDHLKESLTGLL